MPYPKAMLIDLDDTILDTTLSADRVWMLTAEAFSQEIGRPAAEIDDVLNESRAWYWADPVRNRAGRLNLHQSRVDVTLHGLQALGHGDADLAERFVQHYSEHRVRSMEPFDGAIQAIESFRAAGVKLALLSNGHGGSQRDKVTTFDLAKHFEIVLIEGEIGYGKPTPRVFERALEACNAYPNEAWCIGDNLEWEVEGPQKMGIKGIWHDWNHQGLPAGTHIQPDRIINRLSELIEA